MENFKKFELTAVWKKQVVGGIRGIRHQAKIIKMSDLAERIPEPTIHIFSHDNRKKYHGMIWMNVPAMFRR